ncbi:DNA replication complex GINS protein SLD5-like isoform X2 [Gossypium australe]|uniref:DNA replication complex GINS protein SLD5-like isoform X2 n=1 Tax=Gossypium australe TaxID=47621 RepID=A0A5B6WSZ1_9ROSI|nr:DNA replication complex GINS protein SLD5-like isoform X2 [Gossypium australe]
MKSWCWCRLRNSCFISGKWILIGTGFQYKRKSLPKETVLSKLPDNYQSILKQSIISREDDMVPKPQLDTFVVAKCERATRPLYLDGSRQFASFDSRQFAILTSALLNNI